MRGTGTRIDRSELTARQLDWKRRVAEAFDRATDSYEQHATVQRQVADQLAAWLPEQLQGQHIESALEIGCGTGFLTALMIRSFPATCWTVTDVSPNMVGKCHQRFVEIPNICFDVADGERLDLPSHLPNRFDLICSNLAFQWFVDLPGALPRLMDHLNPGGWLIFTTLAEENFSLVYERFPFLKATANIGDRRIDIIESLESSGGTVVTKQEMFRPSCANLGEFLGSLKQTGAATPSLDRLVENGALRAALRDSRSLEGPVEVNYQVLFVAVQNTRD